MKHRLTMTKQELADLKYVGEERYWQIREHVVAMGMLPPSIKFVAAIIQAYEKTNKPK